jgi:hypothetical protein
MLGTLKMGGDGKAKQSFTRLEEPVGNLLLHQFFVFGFTGLVNRRSEQ